MQRRKFIYMLASPFLAAAAPAPTPPKADLSGLTTHHNQTTDKNFTKGKIVLAGEIFTACPLICPRLKLIKKKALEKIASTNPEIANKIMPIMITVDPDRDTPSQLRNYLSGTTITGLTGTKEALSRALSSIGYSGNLTNPNDHVTSFRFISPDGSVKGIRTDEITPAQRQILDAETDFTEKNRKKLEFNIENIAKTVIRLSNEIQPGPGPAAYDIK